MKNKSKGIISLFMGLLVLGIVSVIVYFTNSVAIWISEATGASSEASIGIQIIVLILAVVILLSVILFGLLLVGVGVGYLFNITPFEMADKIRRKIYGDAFCDDFFDLRS